MKVEEKLQSLALSLVDQVNNAMIFPERPDLGITVNDLHTSNLADLALEVARGNPRRRFIFKIHQSEKEEMHLMVNAISETSYVRPHRHNEKVKREMFRILKGEAWVVIFEDGQDDKIKKVIHLNVDDPDGRKVALIKPGEFHTIVSDGAYVILEAKRQPGGGYNPKTDKEFAGWAPEEMVEGDGGKVQNPTGIEYNIALLKRAKEWKPE